MHASNVSKLPAEDVGQVRDRLLRSIPHAAGIPDGGFNVRVKPTMSLALCYTRFSTLAQSELSTERQIQDCDKYASRAGFDLEQKHIYSDEGRSGFYMVGRQGLSDMLARAGQGDVRAVIIADPSRLARDMVDLGLLYRHLKRLGVELHSASGGRLDAAQIALYGLTNQQQIEFLVHNTSFARRAMVQGLRVPWGAKSFGYERDGHEGGKIRENPAEAETVVKIFLMARAGVACVRIARILNDEGCLNRRAKPWTADAILRVLRNPLYAGIIAYGRKKHVKDPETLRTKVELVPRQQWEVAYAKHLRIVEQDVWDDVQSTYRPAKLRKARRTGAFLLSRLARCPDCDGEMICMGGPSGDEERRFVCSAHNYNEGCGNQRSWSMSWIENATLGLLAGVLDDPSLFEPYLMSLGAHAESAHAEFAAQRAALERQLEDLEDESVATWNPKKTDGLTKKGIARIRERVKRDIDRVEEALASIPSPRAAIDVAARLAELGGLADALKELPTLAPLDTGTKEGAMLAATIRGLIRRVVPTPVPGSNGVHVELTLAELGFYDPVVAADAGPTRVVSGTFLRPTVEEQRLRSGEAEAAAHLASGLCTVDDATWSRLRHLVSPSAPRRPGDPSLDGRSCIEAMLLALRLRRPFADLPTTFGDRAVTGNAVKSLVRCGAWAAAVPILREHAPQLLEGVDVHRFDYAYKGSCKARTAGGAPSRNRRGVVERLVTGPAGATLAELQAATGLSAHAVRSAVSRLRLHGLDVRRTRKRGETSVWRAAVPSG